MTIKVSIDASGGDFGFSVTINAGINALSTYDDLLINFVGDKTEIEKELNNNPLSSKFAKRIVITHASEVISMDDSPSVALRHKKDSSMRVAINLVKSGEVDACVSAGNTGALMSIARFVLKTIKGVDRPAIMSAVPTYTGPTHVLDLGANIDSKPGTLLQFAIMGSIAVQNTESIDRPSVGLLNIGSEELKGNTVIKNTYQDLSKLESSLFEFKGYVEGNNIMSGEVNVIIADGFTGNIALKTAEGTANFITSELKKALTGDLLGKISSLLNIKNINYFKKKLDPRMYNGANLLGLNSPVVKSHGGTDFVGFANAISVCEKIIKGQLIDKIKANIN